MTADERTKVYKQVAAHNMSIGLSAHGGCRKCGYFPDTLAHLMRCCDNDKELLVRNYKPVYSNWSNKRFLEEYGK
jgi:hypothetical protein